jgi:hypothetical protein
MTIETMNDFLPSWARSHGNVEHRSGVPQSPDPVAGPQALYAIQIDPPIDAHGRTIWIADAHRDEANTSP